MLVWIEKVTLLTAILLPVVTVIVFLVRIALVSRNSQFAYPLKLSLLISIVVGGIVGLILVGIFWGPPFKVVNYNFALRSLAEDVSPIGIAGSISLVLAFGISYLVYRIRGQALLWALAIVPAFIALPSLGVQLVNTEIIRDAGDSEPPPKYPESVLISDRATVEIIAPDVRFTTSLITDSEGRIIFTGFSSGDIGLLEPNSDGTFERKELANVPLPDGTVSEQGLWHSALNADETFLYAFAIDKLSNPGRYTDEASKPDLSLLRGDTSRVVRFPYDDGKAGPMEVILDGIPAGAWHSGGAMTFGPDGNLYLGVGDMRLRYPARIPRSIVGSILRYTPDGLVPSDSVLRGSPVYAYGFRNPYGLAFHPESGKLFATSNGPKCCDQLILVEPGQFHGWPDYGDDPSDIIEARSAPGVVAPIFDSGDARPAFTQLLAYGGDRYGAEFKGNLFFGSFHNGAIYMVSLSDEGDAVDSVEIVWRSPGGEPIIGMTEGVDGYIYFSLLTAIMRIASLK